MSSGELIPGDVYELSDPNLTQLPSDSLLLTGDCIVNESMLTGMFMIAISSPCVLTNVRHRGICPGFEDSSNRYYAGKIGPYRIYSFS